MANSYNWSISGLEILPELNGQQNVVYRVQWVLSTTDGINSYCIGNSSDIDFDPNSDFVSYENLTEEEVLSWVQSALGTETILSLQNDMDNKLLSMPQPNNKPSLPWTN